MVDNIKIEQIKEWRKGENPEVTLSEIKKILSKWHSLSWAWESWLLILGIAAISSSLFISGFAQYKFMTAYESLPLKILGFVSALSLTAISTFNMPTKANNLRKAWRHLNKAYYRYHAGIDNISELVKAYDEGEEMIGATIDFNYGKRTNTP